MVNYNWVKICDMVEELYHEDSNNFNEESRYCILRRYNSELPFSFEKYIKLYKNEYKLKFVERKKVLHDIFMELSIEKRLELLNFVLYFFHKNRLNRKRLNTLEAYLDDNR